MANSESRKYELKKLDITMSNDKTYNIKNIVMDFTYHEAIDASFLRCDFSILDAVDFNLGLVGGENVEIDLVTESSKEDPLKVKLKVYKIGSILKQERQAAYILHCVSPEMYFNEINKVFKAFGPGSKKDVENVPKYICKEFLKADVKKIKKENFENHSKLTFISPSWRPADVITYLSDKVTRTNTSKSSEKQSGFLFFETKEGFNFKSIDKLCETSATQWKYSYAMSGNMEEDEDAANYTIESIQYPDRANHLANMRMGTYKTSVISISIPAPTDSNIQQSGKSSGQQDTVTTQDSGGDKETGVKVNGGTSTAPSGTVIGPKTSTFKSIFSKASTLEKVPPFIPPKDIGDLDDPKTPPTRTKIRALPGLKNIQSTNSLMTSMTTTTTNTSGSDSSSGSSTVSSSSSSVTEYFNQDNLNGNKPTDATSGKEENRNTVAVAQYAAGRYNLLRAVQLNITVPGNTALMAGQVITVNLPSAREEGDDVQEDFRYSGKYLIAGLTHIWKQSGLTTRLQLVRDSTKKKV
tara:strand:+ start:15197 stop:16768 length:1572 start_codon:yes stop_codon:yes gene_type:complete